MFDMYVFCFEDGCFWDDYGFLICQKRIVNIGSMCKFLKLLIFKVIIKIIRYNRNNRIVCSCM